MNTPPVVATISWARDEQEEEVLRGALKVLSETGLQVFVTDGGSGDDFIHFLQNLPGFTVLQAQNKGLWAQAQTSLLAAADQSYFILYTEPDKAGFFARLPNMLSAIAATEQTGVVLASRSAIALSSFPDFQQITEATINRCCEEMIGNSFDYTYGPFLLNRQVLSYVNNLPNDIGWGWRPFVFAIAARLGLQINNYTDNFYCPPAQQTDNAAERLYRMKQLTQNINGLVLAAGANISSI